MPDSSPSCPLAPALAQRIREARETLTQRWLERISARVSLDPNRVFPTEDLLDHVPLLIDGIAAYVEDPAREVPAGAPVIGKAMELGALRHAQGLRRVPDPQGVRAPRRHPLRALHRRGAHDGRAVREGRAARVRAPAVPRRRDHPGGERRALPPADARPPREREERLRGFNRALTHELKNQIGAVMGAGELLDLDGLPDAERPRLVGVVRRNAAAMRGTLDNLVELSRMDSDARQQRRVLLPQAATEAARQLRDAAAAAGVAVRVGELPPVEVPAAAVELAVTNYLSNAIKYADHERPERWVEVRGHTTAAGPDAMPETVVEVWDNGIGVPAEKRDGLFARGFRAHAETITGVEGTGLGLSIVKDAIEASGGRVWATFPPHGGACFCFALPARRAREAAAARARGLTRSRADVGSSCARRDGR
jgi:signal transduction histidine kinase